jgi:NAD(P)-dependent dehydrogenase (short-subunit alcohol dehydrogenase family)
MAALDGRVSVVTGGGNGIGRAICHAMAAVGADVVVADLDEAAAAEVTAEINARGGSATAIAVDVGSVPSIDAMIRAVVEQKGRIDNIVNNAGVTVKAHIMDLTEDDWDRIHRINAKGVFFCLQSAARAMIEGNGGNIINIASIAGKGYAGTSNAAYAASKGAVISLTKTAAQQLGRHDIRVNSICPGVTRTDLLERIFDRQMELEGRTRDEVETRAARGIPLRRLNDPEDIGNMAVFLASDGSRNITGQSFNVDGGIIPD